MQVELIFIQALHNHAKKCILTVKNEWQKKVTGNKTIYSKSLRISSTVGLFQESNIG